jgi:uncharacterized LabA/DUF88 family protein
MEHQIAVYWDFENIHAAVYENSGEAVDPYRDTFFKPQPEAVSIAAIMEYISSKGTVCLNRAYANWEPMRKYARRLQEWSVDLIQLYPAGKSSKNGADIRLSIDIIEDMARLPHIDTIVLIAGDSDFIPVVRKIREKGRRVIGISEQKSTNPNLVKSCHEFKFYKTLTARIKADADAAPTAEDSTKAPGLSLKQAKGLAKSAMLSSMKNSGEPTVTKGALKNMMLRLEPSFDESLYQFSSFTDFIKACSDWLMEEPGQQLRMRNG